MKKIFAVLCAIMLMCALPIVSFAEETDTMEATETDTTETTETVPSEAPVDATTVDMVLEYIQSHPEEFSVIVTLILTIFYNARKHKLLNKSIGTLNNNAVAVAEDSKESIQSALNTMSVVSEVVGAYKEKIDALLTAFQITVEEKKAIEQTLAEVHKSLNSAKLANMELANELAELLVLANIPNSKKEELYARHLAAVGAIADADKTEVITDDDGKAEE